MKEEYLMIIFGEFSQFFHKKKYVVGTNEFLWENE